MDFCGLTKTSTLDYPGKIAAVLFAPLCNYDCFYCHNRALLEKEAPLMDPKEITDFLDKRQGLVDAVVLTGGEATLQSGLVDFAKMLKDKGYLVKLDTNGSNPDVVQKLIDGKLLDYVALDYKAPWDRYTEICGKGADSEAVKKTIDFLVDAGFDFELRTTVIPQLSLKDLTQMAQAVPKVPHFMLQQYKEPQYYKPEDQFRIRQKPYGLLTLIEMAGKISPLQPNVAVR
ncbi:MAG: anaerobic ribonucleoside-triphosphate reductase activating protein [Eubacteriales bacterium]